MPDYLAEMEESPPQNNTWHINALSIARWGYWVSLVSTYANYAGEFMSWIRVSIWLLLSGSHQCYLKDDWIICVHVHANHVLKRLGKYLNRLTPGQTSNCRGAPAQVGACSRDKCGVGADVAYKLSPPWSTCPSGSTNISIWGLPYPRKVFNQVFALESILWLSKSLSRIIQP